MKKAVKTFTYIPGNEMEFSETCKFKKKLVVL